MTVKDTISYVLSIKPQTRRAIAFQNITVQIAKGKTTAFLSTYVPTKEWIAGYKGKKRIGFKGSISINKINLDDFKINNTGNMSNGSGKLASINASSNIIFNKISLAPGECEVYDVLEPYQCYYGHWPDQNCDYNSEDHEWFDFPPGYNYVSTVINCAAPEFPTPPGTGGSGGGNTTPYPPGQYDPCTGLPIASQSYAKVNGGLKLAIVPPPPCDGDGGGEGGGGLYPIPQVTTRIITLDPSITNNQKINCLLNKLLGKNGNTVNQQFANLVNAFVGKGFNLTFKIGTTKDPNSKAETTYDPNSPTNYFITINSAKVDSESQMSLVKTLLHEAFHANLMQKAYEMFGDQVIGLWAIGPKDMTLTELMNKIENVIQPTPTLAQQHHEFMAMNIGIIKNGLKAFSLANNTNHTNFNEDRFEALAYQGLELTSYYVNKVCKDLNAML